MKKIIHFLFMIILMSILVYALSVEYINPIDEFYLIKEGGVMGNITFEVNSTPTGASGAIMNVTLYHNISGTFKINFTDTTIITTSIEVNTTFPSENTSIFSKDLLDGSVFVWNTYVCDNVTSFYNEDVFLDAPDVFTIFDNYTNLTGDGLCDVNCTNSFIVTAGRGRLVNYPVLTLDGVENTTGEILSACILNGSTDGYFRCNQTKTTYNGSGNTILTEVISTSSVRVNYTISSSCSFIGSNRTVYVEDAPVITVNNPTTGGYSDSETVDINITVTGDDATYLCYIYSNDTGNWTQEPGANTAVNNTLKSTYKVFSEGNIVWNPRCDETGNSNIYGWSSNQSIIVDTTNPAITLNSPSDNSYVNHIIGTEGYSAIINLTVIDANANTCILRVNGSINRTKSYTSGTQLNMTFNATDGNYEWNVICSDDAARTTETTNRTITIDTVMPGILRNINYTSSAANCKRFTVEFNSSEQVNLTFKYGLTSMSQTFTEIESDYAINQTVPLNFNDSYETTFYANASICDRAANCNTSYSEMTIPSPIPLCTGWSLWSIYDLTINLSDYRLTSGADFVYYWNNTGQSWIFSSAAGSSSESHDMKIGDVVQLYESTNTTYFRNNTGTPQYYLNITGGHVYFGLYHEYSFGNISYNLFRNESGGNTTSNDSNSYFGDAMNSTEGLEFQIDYLSGFNNSNQEYIDAPFRWSWNNDTILGKNYKNYLDTLWAYIPYNITINFTPGGEIIGNHTGG